MLAESPMRPSTPKASAASLPPPLLRLLPGGANQFPGGFNSRCGPPPFTAHLVTRLNVQAPTVLQPGATKQSGNTIKYFGSDIGVCSSRTQGPRRAALRPSLHLDTT